jgi:nicotinamide-nucleotide amidase
VKQVVLHIHGYPESEIDEMIRPAAQKNWNQKDLKVTFGILAHQSIIDVKASVEGNKVQRVQEVLNRIEDELRKILGSRVYGKNEETLEQAVGHLLRKRGEQLAIAESCTGGLIADQITNIPGSSDYFKEGVVAYSNESKIKRLRVSSQTLQKFGAVSEPTAGEMAKGILKTSGADWGIAVTGIAGPGGGTKEKPAGLVCFAIASPKNVQSWTRRFFGSRTEIKQKSALMALDLLRQQLKLQPNPTKYSDS